MSDPLVHHHDPAAASLSSVANPGARPAGDRPESAPESTPGDAAKVVTLAQLLAAEAGSEEPTVSSVPSDSSPSSGSAADVEYGGPKGPEPTRYGDWEKGGRCIDF